MAVTGKSADRLAMTADQVIDLRKLWVNNSIHPALPVATVLAERDWTAYVRAMTGMVPASDELVWPTVQEVNWAWPDGVVLVFAEPVEISHKIISKQSFDYTGRPVVKQTDPHLEQQMLRGLVVSPEMLSPTVTPDGVFGSEVSAAPILWIADDPSDVISGWWMPGGVMHETHEDGISEASRFLVSVIAALGHRLTRMELPVTAGRGERRRVARELPSLRVLQLSSGASVSSEHEPGRVEWSHRWMVRGHWRQQPCGTQRRFRRLKWIDPYVKGPEDKPLDVRPTIWSTGKQVPEGRR